MNDKRQIRDESEINITPMLDIVFILLIFFIVTTSFVKERGLEVARPGASNHGLYVKAKPIVVKINASSVITVDNRIVEENAVRANLEQKHGQSPESPMIIASHPDAETNALIAILDAANIVGIGSISVATTSR